MDLPDDSRNSFFLIMRCCQAVRGMTERACISWDIGVRGGRGCLRVTWIMNTLLWANGVSLRPGLDLDASGQAHCHLQGNCIASLLGLCLEDAPPVSPGSGKGGAFLVFPQH